MRTGIVVGFISRPALKIPASFNYNLVKPCATIVIELNSFNSASYLKSSPIVQPPAYIVILYRLYIVF